MAKTLCHIHLKFEIKYSSLIIFTQQQQQKKKLVPNWKGAAEIIDIEDTKAKVQIGRKVKVLDIAKWKYFYNKSEETSDTDTDFNF